MSLKPKIKLMIKKYAYKNDNYTNNTTNTCMKPKYRQKIQMIQTSTAVSSMTKITGQCSLVKITLMIMEYAYKNDNYTNNTTNNYMY